MKKLFSFYWDCGRHGDVEGLFIATQKEVDDAIGKGVYFGEILGKHSEIYGTLDEQDIKMVSEDTEKVIWIEGLLSSDVCGYNPLTYLE